MLEQDVPSDQARLTRREFAVFIAGIIEFFGVAWLVSQFGGSIPTMGETGENTVPWAEVKDLRQARRIRPFVTDYLPDVEDMGMDERVSYYELLKEKLGIHFVRTEL